jgi:tRNA (guanine6-N2)-methyltransferase
VSEPGTPGTDGRTAIVVRCVHGLEWVCAWEIATHAEVAGGVRVSRRQVDFETGAVDAWLLGLRTADDVFVRVTEIDGVGRTKADLPALGKAAAAVDWRPALQSIRAVRRIPEQGTFDVVASIEGRHSYNRFAVERSVGLAVAPILGATFAERDGAGGRVGGDSDVTVRVLVRDDQAVIALRLGARPLHRRAYKSSTGPGTLHPPVAAALVEIGAPAAGTLTDPFCGDGTIAIEAARARTHLHIMASDLDPQRVRNATENARRAGVRIDIRLADAARIAASADVDAIITNPPWNQAVSASEQLRAAGHGFVDSLAGALSKDGVVCCTTDAGLGVPALLVRLGWQLGLEQRIRLAGRVADISLAAPPGRSAPTLPAGLESWREQALAAGVVTQSGF